VEFPPAQFQAVTEEWNGTSWTEVADLNTARQQFSRIWNKNFCLAATGEDPGRVALTESWNGTSWTEGCRYKCN
jgi:hypothetical protein